MPEQQRSDVGKLGWRWAVSSSPPRRGPVAQLGARLNGIKKVRGSTPLGSTLFLNTKSAFGRPAQVVRVAFDTLFDTLSRHRSCPDEALVGQRHAPIPEAPEAS